MCPRSLAISSATWAARASSVFCRAASVVRVLASHSSAEKTLLAGDAVRAAGGLTLRVSSPGRVLPIAPG